MNSLICILLISICSTLASHTELLQVIVLTRHGDRTPIRVFPNSRSEWPEGFGQLTNLGMKQHYELGQLYRKLYIEERKFINNTYRVNEVFVRSTPKERTLMSAHSFMMGFFPPDSGHNLPAQPVPIFSADKKSDLLLYAYKNCPRIKQMTKEAQLREEWKATHEQHSSFLQHLSDIFGTNISLKDTSTIVHLVQGEINHGRKRLEQFTHDMLAKVKQIASWVLQRKFDKPMGRLGAGNLVKEIRDRFNIAKSSHKDNKKHDHRFILFSGHDGTILSLFAALDLSHLDIPLYAAHVTFELHYSNYDNDYHITILYNGNPVDYPNCGTKCPLDRFISLTEESIPLDWHNECKLEDALLAWKYDILHVVPLSIGFILGILATRFLSKKSSSKTHTNKKKQ